MKAKKKKERKILDQGSEEKRINMQKEREREKKKRKNNGPHCIGNCVF